ncbi:hypothetical protein BVER_04729c [Candidatus Burkholderia verschuerenii]|uniref:Purine nucleoside phosphorylase n=1 Tax=Candidatus Burkholderia verschuerenii TaxID=242163 RepID=A0A0L0MC65_9BURK|nr:DUF4148 domain-containing protein [Candidatus Burkholderia verschuerenii]KND59938.1 hypothetical protein BVER_04729c [Candidatus Burkholderia verschuerenii]
MKIFPCTIAIVALLVTPIASYADTGNDVSRAQVKAELVRIEQAGYRPTAEQADYPAALQAAETRVTSRRVAMIQATDYGSSTDSGSQAGAGNKRVDPRDTFMGH